MSNRSTISKIQVPDEKKGWDESSCNSMRASLAETLKAERNGRKKVKIGGAKKEQTPAVVGKPPKPVVD